MNQATFNGYIKYLDDKHKRHPLLFNLKLILFIIFGQCYLIFFLGLLSLTLEALCFTFLLNPGVNALLIAFNIFLLYFTAFGIIRMTCFRINKPNGVQIKRKDAPHLFDMIDHLSDKLNCKTIHKVLLGNENNVTISQIAALKVFGFYQNVLVIGMPLLFELDKEQFEAILAHELVFISKSHRFLNTVYRVNKTWTKFGEDLRKNVLSGDFLYERFSFWFIERLNASAFVLSKELEFKADQFAAKLTNAKTFSDALALIYLFDRHLEGNFWDDYYTLAKDCKEVAPFYNPFIKTIEQGLTEKFRERYYSRLNHQISTFFSERPSYSKRIATINQHPIMPNPSEITAAKVFFGNNLSTYIIQCEKLWSTENELYWHRIHRECSVDRLKLLNLENTAFERELNANEVYKCALYTNRLNGYKAAEPLYHKALNIDIYHSGANFVIGKKLLYDGDDLGIEKIKMSYNRDISFFGEGFKLIYHYLIENRKYEEAEKYDASQLRTKEKYNDYYNFHHTLTAHQEPLTIQGITDTTMNTIQKILGDFPLVKCAYLTNKSIPKDLKYNETLVLITYIKNYWRYDKLQLETLREELRFAMQQMDKNILVFLPSEIRSLKYAKFIKKHNCIKVK